MEATAYATVPAIAMVPIATTAEAQPIEAARPTPAVQDVFERTEKKYLLTPEQYSFLMRSIQDRLGYDEFGQSLISSLYYDTPDDEMINRSMEKPLYKEKLRVRSYGTPGPQDAVFVELKKKFKGIVYKRRVSMSLTAAEAYMGGMPYLDAITRYPLSDEDRQRECTSAKALQISRELDACKARYTGLRPSMMIITNRVAMRTNDGSDVRITFDVDPIWRDERLSFADGFGGNQLLPDGRIIMEVKCLNAYPLWLARALTAGNIYPVSCSKYGRAYKIAHPAQPAAASDRAMAYLAPEPKQSFFSSITVGSHAAHGANRKKGASCA
jgi:hypothetical protein